MLRVRAFVSLCIAFVFVVGMVTGCRERTGKTLTDDDGVDLTLDLGGGVTMGLVLIEAGEFVMGSPSSEADRNADEGPQHRVRISKPFYMGKYEVTQAQWLAVMGNNPSDFEDCGNDCPVEQVSWEKCQEFCKRLSQRVGRDVRLPTEAEWEYACRAGTTTVYSFGDNSNRLGDYAWYHENCWGTHWGTNTVGTKRANPWGLHDMLGNVSELCEDTWHESYFGAPSDGSAWTTGGDSLYRVERGGDWNSSGWSFRSAYRYRTTPDFRYSCTGFRCVVGT